MGVQDSGSGNPPGQLPRSFTLFAPADATAPKVCRDFVSGVLGAMGLDHLADRAALCTSELVTNAHLYAEGDVHLRFGVELTHVRVAVYDGSPKLPTPQRAPVDAEHGRGLFLVTSLSDLCGTTPHGDHGKGVWFELNTGWAERR